MIPLLPLLGALVSLYILLIVVRSLLSWVPNLRYKYRSAATWLEKITDPVLRPCQRLVPPSKTGGIDFSPVIAILGIRFIWQMLLQFILGGR